MFYVYEWYNVDTNEIFYVGKGCRERYKQITKRNKLFQEYYKNNHCNSRIIKYFEKEEDAFKYENERILELKGIGQCFCNLDNGGKGGVNFAWTDEMKEYQSKYNPMKDDKQKERMSKNNPMKNPEIAKKVGKKHSKPIIIGDKKYESFSLTVKEVGNRLITWLKYGYTDDGEPCYYEEKGKPKHSFVKKEDRNNYNTIPILYNGKIYKRIGCLTKELNVGRTTIYNYIKKGYTPEGIECRRLTDEPTTKMKPNKCFKPVLIDGKYFETLKEASEYIKVDRSTLRKYLKQNKLCKGHKCEYANQQPRPVNS